ncbi:phage tail terminator protein [Enterococcus sp. LJL99]
MNKELDFIYRFIDKLNTLALMTKVIPGSLKDEKSIAVTLLPGGKTITTYYNGMQEKAINIQVALKTKNQKEAIDNLNKISEFVEELSSLESENNSFQFVKIVNSSEPFHQSNDDKGNWIFVFDTGAQIIIDRSK